MVLDDLNEVAVAQRRRARRLDCSLVVVGVLSLASLATVFGTVTASRPVALRYETVTIELRRELAVHQGRCDALLLGLSPGGGIGSDG